jgi:syntaxin 5
MVARDRTAELQSIVEHMRREGRVPIGGAESPKPAPRPALSPAASRFAEAAAAFSKDLASTSMSLANLTKLIQQQSVFDDQAPEIGSLTTIVKSRLSKMHDDLAALAELRADAAVGPSTSQPNRHSEAVISTLRTKLVSTSQDFKTILQRRTKSIKETAMRRNKLSSDKPQTFESALFRQQPQDDGRDGSGGGLLAQDQMLANSNAQHYRQRYDAVRQIEAAVHEVGEMFQDFTRLVHEQDETIVRIDTEVDESLGYVNAGTSQLMTYIANLSSNRGMILKIFAILFVFLLFFGFVVVR